MKRNRALGVLAVWAAVGLGAALRGLAQVPDGYEVIQVSDDPDYDGPPAINNCGQVVFSKRINQSFDGEEIFLYDDRTGETTRLTDDNVRDAYPDINDNGTIVWSRGVGPGGTLEVAMYKNGELTILTDSPYGYSCYSPQVNNVDHITWDQANRQGCGASDSDIFFYDGTTFRQITSGGFSHQLTRLNNYDEIVWTRLDLCAQPWWIGEIMLYSGGAIAQITDDATQLGGPDINDAGVIAWTRGNLIEVFENGARWPLTQPAGGPRLNDYNDIAYNCWQTDTHTWQACLHREGIFLQLTDEAVWNSGGSVNDLGEIAWERGNYPLVDIALMRSTQAEGDSDRDGDADLFDYVVFAVCLAGPSTSECHGVCGLFDFDFDADIDLEDYGAFQRAFSIDDS